MANENYVTLEDMSEKIGMTPSAIRKSMKKRGFEVTLKRTLESRGQLVSVVPISVARRYIAAFKSEFIPPKDKREAL